MRRRLCTRIPHPRERHARVGHPRSTVNVIATLVLIAICFSFCVDGQVSPDRNGTNGQSVFVVFLGTGMPRPNPERQGPSLAMVCNGKAYLVDAGVGVVRQAAA